MLGNGVGDIHNFQNEEQATISFSNVDEINALKEMLARSQEENERMRHEVTELKSQVHFLRENGIFPSDSASESSIIYARIICGASSAPYSMAEDTVVDQVFLSSQTAYKYTREVLKFSLPLRSVAQVGIPSDFDSVYSLLEGMAEEDKKCAVCFDELNITDIENETNGSALGVELVGLVNGWRFLVGFYNTSHFTSGTQLNSVLEEVMDFIGDLPIEPKVIVCDSKSVNNSALALHKNPSSYPPKVSYNTMRNINIVHDITHSLIRVHYNFVKKKYFGA